jgi:hypothetical protein
VRARASVEAFPVLEIIAAYATTAVMYCLIAFAGVVASALLGLFAVALASAALERKAGDGAADIGPTRPMGLWAAVRRFSVSRTPVAGMRVARSEVDAEHGRVALSLRKVAGQTQGPAPAVEADGDQRPMPPEERAGARLQ